MNKQRKVLITITYNEMGIIIETKAEEVAQPNLQPTCNQLATDCISRQMAIDAFYVQSDDDGWWCGTAQDAEELLKGLPYAEPEIIRCKDCKWSDTRPGVWDCHNPVFGDGYAYYSPPCMREDDYCSRAERRPE